MKNAISADHERACAVGPRLRRPHRSRVRFSRAGHGAAARGRGPPPAVSLVGLGVGVGRVDEQRHEGRHRDQLVQQLQPLRPQLHVQGGRAREVRARPVQAGDKSKLDRVATDHEDDRNRRVAAFAASAEGIPPVRQSRPPDDEPDRLPMPAADRIGPPPSDIRSRHCGPQHSRSRPGLAGTRANGGRRSGESLLRNPITGIAGCCARAASGQAAAPPSRVMNSRRLTRSPRRRC